MNGAIAASHRRFEIPGTARIVQGNGGLPKVSITSPQAAGEIYLHGAHVTSWKPRGREEVFFLSSQSRWQDGSAIRGGVPICFPWFGGKADDPKAPAHGFVRTKAWQLESITQAGGAVTVSMFAESSADTKRWWAADFRLVYRVTFDSELTLELEVTNTGGTPRASRKRYMRTIEWGTSRRRACAVWTAFAIWIRPTQTGKRCSTARSRLSLKPTACT